MVDQTHSAPSTPQSEEGPSEEGPAVAVVAVGNEILGDDGVGPQLVRRLEETALGTNDDVRLVNAGTTAFFALEGLSGCGRGIVLDAVQSDAPPGTIHEYRCVDGSFEGEVPDMTMHDISFTEALSYSRSVYDLPDEIRVIGIESASIEPAVELSDPVEAALPELIEMLTETIQRLVARESPAATEYEEQS